MASETELRPTLGSIEAIEDEGARDDDSVGQCVCTA